MAGQMRVSRRAVTRSAGLVGLTVLGVGGCDSSPARKSAAGAPARSPVSSPTPDPAAVADARLRERAIADERRLLAAAAAPAGVEPFATVRGLHRRHLETLTGLLPADPAARAAPATAALAFAEHAASTARRADCEAASSTLAPLLASLAASSAVAVSLLTPPPS